MSSGQALKTQMLLEPANDIHNLTVFTPPGITVDTAKYPILMSGFLAATKPSEYLSIYDHPEAWKGLDRDAITTMRRSLYRFAVPLDARTMQPREVVEALQTIALSVNPVALGVEAYSLPPSDLHVLPGQLPCGPSVKVKSVEILSEPEKSKVAERISQKDIPASESVWQLIDYDYSLDQIVRLFSVGLLGRKCNRRLVPIRGAYKAAIDAFIDRAVMELSEAPHSSISELYMTIFQGDTIIVFMQPGEARVDYLNLEQTKDGYMVGSSFEDLRHAPMNRKISVFADHARFSAYYNLIRKETASHVTIFHYSRNQRNGVLGPWIIRAGIMEALATTPVQLEDNANALTVLETVLKPSLDIWSRNTPLMSRLDPENHVDETALQLMNVK